MDSSKKTIHPILELAVVAALFLALAIAMTWPLAANITDKAIFGQRANDIHFNTWVIFWGAHSLITDPLNMHHANMFHPERYTFAYSDIELSHSVLMMPVILLFNNPEMTYSLLLLLGMCIGGLGFYVLARDLIQHRIASFAAAVLFVFAPWHFGRIFQIQFFGDFWLPWFLWALIRWLKGYKSSDYVPWKWAAATGLFYCLHALSGSHNAVFGTIAGVALALFLILRDKVWQEKRFWIHGVLASAGVVIVLGFVFYPYLIVEKELAAQRVSTLHSLRAGSAGAHELLSSNSSFYRWLNETAGWPSAMFERRASTSLFPGISLLILSLMGLFSSPVQKENLKKPFSWAHLIEVAILVFVIMALITLYSGLALFGSTALLSSLLFVGAAILGAVRFRYFGKEEHCVIRLAKTIAYRFNTSGQNLLWLGLFIFAFWASLGPDAWLYRLLANVPLVKLIRVPARFMLLASFALTVLSIRGTFALFNNKELRGKILLYALVVVFLVESMFAPFPLHDAWEPPEVYRWLGEQEGDFAVIELPLDPKGYTSFMRQLYGSIYHWKTLIVGYSGYQSNENVALLTRINTSFPSDGCLEELRSLGVKYAIVFEKQLDDMKRQELAVQENLIRVKDYTGYTVYELSGAQGLQ